MLFFPMGALVLFQKKQEPCAWIIGRSTREPNHQEQVSALIADFFALINKREILLEDLRSGLLPSAYLGRRRAKDEDDLCDKQATLLN